MSIILSGTQAREALIPSLIERIKSLSYVPTLAIIQVGDRADSTSYIRAKKSFATKIGVNEKHIQFPENISQQELISRVQELNTDPKIQGIIVQLPLPLEIDSDTVIETIDPRKDVDGLTAHNVKGWTEGREDAILPATARGVMELLKFYKIELFGKKVTVIGRSMLVGKPIAAMCISEGAEVTVCHSKTLDLVSETKMADIIIVAVGKPGLIQAKHVREGQIVIDVGISAVNSTDAQVGLQINSSAIGSFIDSSSLINNPITSSHNTKRLVGDVDFDAVKDIVAGITPVPGGVGPMTVLGLFENLVDLGR